VTRFLRRLCKLADVRVLDHFVVAGLVGWYYHAVRDITERYARHAIVTVCRGTAASTAVTGGRQGSTCYYNTMAYNNNHCTTQASAILNISNTVITSHADTLEVVLFWVQRSRSQDQ